MKQILSLLAFLTSVAYAVDPPTASQSDVQTAINNTANGGTVNLPAGQSATWTSPVSIPNKGITLNLNGCTITRSAPSLNAPILTASSASTFTTRITGGTFTGGGSGTGSNARYIGISSTANGKIRIDNCVFNNVGGGVYVDVTCREGQALVDTCTFYANSPNEIIHVLGYGPASPQSDVTTGLAGWNIDVTPGSLEAAYIENCDFVWTGAASGGVGANAAMQMYYGARAVFRYNRVRGAVWDCHGDSTYHAGRWWELYENHFYHGSIAGSNHNYSDKVFQIRGGSGVVYNNTLHRGGGAFGNPGITLWNERPGDPAPCQVGRGKNVVANNHANQNSDPIYIWNNTVIDDGYGGGNKAMPIGQSYGASSAPGGTPGAIKTPRDYIEGIKSGWPAAAAPYPHPMTGAVLPPSTVAEPVLSPAAGPYFGTISVSMTTPTAGASYYYTLDGSAPTASSTLYTGPFTLSTTGTTIVRAIGIKTGETSSGGAAFSPGIAYEINSWSVTGSGVFKTIQTPAQVGDFTWSFRVNFTATNADAVVGMGPDAVTTNDGMGAMMLFNDQGIVQVRNGGSYNPGTFGYGIGSYDVVMVVSQGDHMVRSVKIGTAGTPVGSMTTIATDAAFRSTQSASADSEWVGMRCTNGTMTLSNMSMTPATPPPGTGTVFVDKDVGSDTAGQPGTEALPFASINYAVTRIGPGDEIRVMNSATPYDLTIGGAAGLFITTLSGLPGNPCAIRAYPGHSPKLVGGGGGNLAAIVFGGNPSTGGVGVNNWEIEGLEISNGGFVVLIRNDSHDITFRNNNLHDSGNQVVAINQDSYNVLFENNTLTDGGSLATSQNGEAFYIGTHSTGPATGDETHDVTIRNNIITRMEHEAIDIKHDTYNVLVEGNTISDCAVNFEFGKWAIIANRMVGRTSSPNHVIRNNTISNVKDATLTQSGTGAAFEIETGCQVYNNVIYNTDSDSDGIHTWAIEYVAGDGHPKYFWNNTYTGPSSTAIHAQSGSLNAGNNIGPTGGTSNLAYNAAYFVAPASNNYHLLAGSAPVNAGSPPPAPLSITTDRDGVPRTGGNDIGAYELVGAAPDTTPPTPNPMTFLSIPAAVSTTEVTMTATTASDTSTPIQYWFEEVSDTPGGTDSGWVSSPTYNDTGLQPATLYTYIVKARDAAGNETGASSFEGVTTDPEPVAEATVDCETFNVTTLRVGP